MNKILRRILKTLGWIIVSVIILLVLVIVLIQVPAVQNFAKDKVVSFLQNKIKTKVVIGRLSIAFPKKVVLEDIYFEDQKHDTLLAGKKLAVDISMFQIIHKKIEVNDIELEGIRANIYRLKPDTSFNYQYIINAFVTPKKEPVPKDTSGGFTFAVSHVQFDKILATYKDDQSGSDMYLYLGHFETKIKTFDLDKMNFVIPKIDLESIIARVYQHQPLVQQVQTPAQAQATASQPMKLGLKIDEVNIKDIAADYGNDVSAMYAQVQLGELQVQPEKLDLATMDIQLKKVLFNNTTAVVRLGRTVQAKKVVAQATNTAVAQAGNPWKVAISKITFSNDHVKFDNDNSPKMKRGMDYAHMDISNFNFDADNLSATPTTYSGDIHQLTFNEQCGFHLRQFHTNFLYDEHGAYLKNLLVQTDKTVIKNELDLAWPSLETVSKNVGELMIKAEFLNTNIAFSDVLTFAPQMAVMPLFQHNQDGILHITSSVKGYVKDLDIANFELSALHSTALKISGRIKGLPNAQKASYNLDIKTFKTSQADLKNVIPAKSMPQSVRIPETIAASGFFVGSMNAFNTKLDIKTSRGSVDVAGVMRNMNEYNITAGTNSLDLGYILKQDTTLGKLTMQISARGAGFDPKKMVADVKTKIISAGAKGYNYQNLVLTAKLNHGNVKVDATMRDPNISFALNADAVLKEKFPSIKMNLALDSINLKGLHLNADEFKVHGNIAADLPSTNPDDLIGNVRITDLILDNKGQRIVMSDTIGVDATAENGGHHLHIFSEILNADLAGNYKLTEVGSALEETINKYYKIPGYKLQHFAAQQWALDVAVKPTPLLYSFVPAMKGSDTIRAAINFNSEGDNLKLVMNAPKIKFGDNNVDSLVVNVNTGAALTYAVTLNSAGNSQFKLFKTSLSGSLQNNQITTALDIKDAANKSRYQLAALINQEENSGYKVSLQQGLMLNYDAWSVPGDNYILYNDAGLVINNFSMSNGSQSISANSESPVASAPINVKFANFKINTLTRIAEQDSLLVDGVINGSAQLKEPTKNLTFNSDIQINDLSYKRDTVGNLSVKVNNETAQTLAADVQIVGHGNDIRLSGKYMIAEKKVDMNLNLANINLAAMKPFASGQLTDAGGSIRGQMAVTGSIDQPTVNGSIRFDTAFVIPTLLGERFAMTNDDIKINAEGIHFNQFSIADSSNNKAIIDGDILTSDFKKYKFGLNISAKNFTAVHSSKAGSDQPFYGNLNLTTDTKIRGDLNAPVINTYLRINKPTDINYILPNNDPEVEGREGVVQFIDMRHPQDSAIFARRSDSIANATKILGLDLNATIETDSAAKFAVIIDERNGDALHIQGAAQLQATIDKSGKTSLTGTYQVESGSYLLTLNFLKRQFNIQTGSTITWNGDPMSATVDLTAIYVANTAPIDLVEHQLSGLSQSEINQYKANLPFNVFLKMKGDLLKPQISFDIDLPPREQDRWKDVETKLAQVRTDDAELNKQVFALLLLGHFVDENPLESNGSATTAESFVRQSAGRILTDQLNKLAGKLITGVDLTFGVNSGDDYSTGTLTQRTDLSVGVSKRLMNDRLKVNVGSTFQVEGPRNSNEAASNIAGDVSVDYQLTKDGRYSVRAYRRNDYDIVEGQVIETGASFIFTVDYDKFKDFFRKSTR